MAAMQITDMTLNGTTNQSEVDGIMKLFPNTALHITGQIITMQHLTGNYMWIFLFFNR